MAVSQGRFRYPGQCVDCRLYNIKVNVRDYVGFLDDTWKRDCVVLVLAADTSIVGRQMFGKVIEARRRRVEVEIFM